VDDSVARERVARVERLLEDVESLPDPRAQDTATSLAQALLDLYGEGLARIVAVLADRDDDGALAAALAGDELVSHLLLLHDLHPLPLEERVRGALADVRPYLESHGGDVELLGVTGEGVARLRLQGSCEGCPSSAATLQLAIEEAIHAAAPDVVRVEADGAVAPAPASSPPTLLQIEPMPPPKRSWSMAGGMPDLDLGSTVVREVDGEAVLFLRLEHRTYAYRPVCPGCGGSLGASPLVGTELTCVECGHRYDVRRAGRCLDDPQVHLEPLPLLVDGEGMVKIALGSAA
jgi:Fe-S cluster biogenesis protein NfuA/nitrite reductase/ring-hydroxylating ferredoxin subunit